MIARSTKWVAEGAHMEMWGTMEVSGGRTSFPCPYPLEDGLEDALAHWPEVAGIVTPPHPMPACREGAG